jgi:AcrR family transcriptional regulator
MSWKRDKPEAPPRGYHHGNLKEELVRAALGLIREKGPNGFTFAEAARLAGVSPAAPYRHFRDRDELLADVATRGFVVFEAALARAWDQGRPDPEAAFHRLGRAYLAFAHDEPAYYSAMFEAGVPLDASPELPESARGLRGADRATARRQPPAGADDGAACLVDVAWRRRAVRPGRWRAAAAADVGGRAARGRHADLSAGARSRSRQGLSLQVRPVRS